jgi:outer membrane protein W
MKINIFLIKVVAALLLLRSISLGQEYTLKGRSALEVQFGFWGGAKASNSVTMNGIQSEANTNGFSGSLVFSHWTQEQLAVTFSAGLLAGKASSTVSTSTINQQASAIIPVLLGVKYYFLSTAQDDAVRPFLSTAMGAYIGSEAENTVMSQSTHSETSFGGQVGAGIDFLLGSHVNLGASVRYNMMSDFSTPIGARSNYNGFNASIGIGIIF